jgi:hypothetical protein
MEAMRRGGKAALECMGGVLCYSDTQFVLGHSVLASRGSGQCAGRDGEEVENRE